MSTDNYFNLLNTYLAGAEKVLYLDEVAFAVDKRRPLWAMIPKRTTVDHRNYTWAVRLGGGLRNISHGNIADHTALEIVQASVDMKHMYHHLTFDRFTLKASVSSKSSFLNFFSDALAQANIARMSELERIIISGNLAGDLGTIDTAGVTDLTGGKYRLAISAATWASGNWDILQVVNVGVSTDAFDVVAISLDNKTIDVLRRTGGSKVPVAAEKLYLQKSKDNEPLGLRQMIEDSGSLFGVTRQFGWESTLVDRTSKPMTEEMLIEIMDRIRLRCDEYPDLLVVSDAGKQALHRLAKANSIRLSESDVRTDNIGMNGAYTSVLPGVPEIMLGNQKVKIVVSPHMPAGSGYFVNTSPKAIEIISNGPGEFIPADSGSGGGILRHVGTITGRDDFEALFAYDYCIKGHPSYHGGWKNLPITGDAVTF